MNDRAAICAYVESLVFDERIEEARALFALHATALAQRWWLRAQVRALRGYFAFHEGDFDRARKELEVVARAKRPLGARASFYLAGLAHRRGDPEEMRRRLADAIRYGGGTFITGWALAQWAERLPGEPPPKARAARAFRPARALAVAGSCVLAMVLAVAIGRSSVRSIQAYRATHVQETKLARAESELAVAEKKAAGLRGDVYFVGGAGWADQSVFLSEVHAARRVFERRFDVDGHAAILANDPAADDDEPTLTTASLRHVLGAVAARMNRDDDVLFLYLTSHGSQQGLALGYGDGARATLAPAALRAMLDDARIRWRVVVIQGCESGVFSDALASDDTLVATAASGDRPSYGCADGNDFTDFGRAFIDHRFASSTNFIDALEGAAAEVREADEWQHRLASEPSVRVGRSVAPKLEALGRR